MVHIQKFEFNLFRENTYVFWDDSLRAAVVDPGCDREAEKKLLKEFITQKGLRIEAILLTHAHPDHIAGVRMLADLSGAPVYMDPKEEETFKYNGRIAALGIPLPESFEYKAVAENDEIVCGDIRFKAISTPGHSPGGMCYLIEKENIILTGDTLFRGAIGRTDNDYASLDDIMDSLLLKLMALDGDIRVLPGHGPVTDIATERLTNPFLYADED